MLRAAVIGAGHQGRHHAWKYAALPGVRLTAVVDIDGPRAARLGAETGAAAYTDHRRVLDRVDLASVAVPVSSHHAIGRDLLDAGVHVLMEKPITRDLAEARDLTALAAARGCVLQIGHLERFSPSILALREHVTRPWFIDARRLGPFIARGTDADVVLDLMIHDIDLALMLADAGVVRVAAWGAQVLSDHIDVANARFQFDNGCVADLTASRVSFGSQRYLRLFQTDAYLAADMSEHVLETYRRSSTRFACDVSGIACTRRQLDRGDALRDQIRAFVDSVVLGSPVAVSGEDGARALAAALAVVEQVQAEGLQILSRRPHQPGDLSR